MKLIEVNVLKEWVEIWFTKNRAYHPYAKNNNIPITELYDILEQMPTAQPEQDEWCTDCKEYDSEKHCCPRFNRVIRKALKDAQPEIVRCAECKWFQYNMRFDGHLPKGVDEFECRHWCGSCDPTDFCSYAERKWEEDEDE